MFSAFICDSMSFWAVAPYMGINERTATHSSHRTRPWLSSLCHLTQTNDSSQSRLTFIIRTLYGLVYNPVMSKLTTQAFLISQYNYNFFNFTFFLLFFQSGRVLKKETQPRHVLTPIKQSPFFFHFHVFWSRHLSAHNPDISIYSQPRHF